MLETVKIKELTTTTGSTKAILLTILLIEGKKQKKTKMEKNTYRMIPFTFRQN